MTLDLAPLVYINDVELSRRRDTFAKVYFRQNVFSTYVSGSIRVKDRPNDFRSAGVI